MHKNDIYEKYEIIYKYLYDVMNICMMLWWTRQDKVCFFRLIWATSKTRSIRLKHGKQNWASSCELWTFALISCLASRDISRSKFNSERYLKSSKSSNLPQLLRLTETPERRVYLLCCSVLFSLKLMCCSVLFSGDQQTLIHLPKCFPRIPCCASNTCPLARVEQLDRTSRASVTSGIYSVKA